MDKVQKVILTNMCQISNGDEILVQYKVSRNYSGVTFPGGHIEENETITEAVVREVFDIINIEYISECFYDIATKEEIIK